MQDPSLLVALDYLALLAELEPERFPAAAVRWHGPARARGADTDAHRVTVRACRACHARRRSTGSSRAASPAAQKARNAPKATRRAWRKTLDSDSTSPAMEGGILLGFAAFGLPILIIVILVVVVLYLLMRRRRR